MKDPNETVHTYDYDRLGRITQDRVTALGTNLDDGILRIEARYDTKRLRHSCATCMHGNGADIRFIQILLGHGSLETTQIYTEVSIEKLREVHARTHPHGGKRKGDQS